MHFVFYARGIKHQLNIWETLAQSQYFKWKRENIDTGEMEEVLVQGALRPSVMGTYEYIFPETALPTVLSMFGITDDKNIGAIPTLSNKLKLSALRKMLGVKKIPKKMSTLHLDQIMNIQVL